MPIPAAARNRSDLAPPPYGNDNIANALIIPDHRLALPLPELLLRRGGQHGGAAWRGERDADLRRRGLRQHPLVLLRGRPGGGCSTSSSTTRSRTAPGSASSGPASSYSTRTTAMASAARPAPPPRISGARSRPAPAPRSGPVCSCRSERCSTGSDGGTYDFYMRWHPDSDGDTLLDGGDRCPNEAGPTRLQRLSGQRRRQHPQSGRSLPGPARRFRRRHLRRMSGRRRRLAARGRQRQVPRPQPEPPQPQRPQAA